MTRSASPHRLLDPGDLRIFDSSESDRRGVLERLLDQRCTPAWKSAAAEPHRVLYVPKLDVPPPHGWSLRPAPGTREC